MKTFLTLLLITILNIKSNCQNSDQLIFELNKIVRPITTINPEDNFDDIESLKDMAKDAAIIGIGESSHGTAIYNTYRQRLIRFLVQEMGYKAIVDEGDILAAEKIDSYINHETDSLEFVGGLRPVITNRKELDWLRSYNINKSEKDRVHIYGAEVRGFYAIIQKLKSIGLVSNVNPILEKLSGDVGVAYRNLTKKDFEEIKKLAENMKDGCNSSICSYYLLLLNQQIDFAYQQRFGRNGFKVRDKYMFENLKSIVSKAPGNKVIILAHNGHLQKSKFLNLTSLGYLLNNFYGSKYFVIATDFNTGNVNIFNVKTGKFENTFFEPVNDSNAIEYYFKQLKYTDFLMPVRSALKNPVTAPLVNNKTKMLRNMGASGKIITSPVRIAENFDLIIFFNNTNSREKL